MVQDFAKIKPEPVLENRSIEAPPAWTLLFTGLITGIAVGVFGCFLLYLSGNVPPLQTRATVTTLEPEPQPAQPVQVQAVAATTEQPTVDTTERPLDYDFYRDLRDYEVEVDATPVPLESPAEATDEPTVTVQTMVEESEPAGISNGRLIQNWSFPGGQ